jgi:cbb3-type cytochrome oxidase maturation protein
MNEHPLYYIILASSFVLLTGSALLALRWALRTGQLRDSKKAALIIFDEDEPVGQMTDLFPGQKPPKSPTNKGAQSCNKP